MNRKQRRAAAKKQRGIPRLPEPTPRESRLLLEASTHHRAGRLTDAERFYRKLLEIDPDHTDALHLLGLIAHETGRSQEALDLIGRAIEVNSIDPDLHNDIAGVYHSCGRYDMAVAHCRKAVALKPDCTQAHLNLGRALTDAHYMLPQQGQLAEAITSIERALTLKPDLLAAQLQLACLRAQMCDWRNYDRESKLILQLVHRGSPSVDPLTLLGRPATQADHLRSAQNWSRKFAIDPSVRFPHHPRAGSRKIRLGYISEDFREHAVAHLIVELIERHDRQRFELSGYSYGEDDGSKTRRRLMTAFDRFIDLKDIDDEKAALSIYNDTIDILIDLQGYTGRPRTRILAYRPAPVQVNFLGYPGTMGTDFIDYILVDRCVVPVDQQQFFTEKIAYLPHCYQPSDTTRSITTPPLRSACGLPEAGFVFCCFNNSFKVTPELFGIWMRLLQGIPASVLWLLESDPLVSGNLRREATRRGVSSKRLIFAPRVPHADHLARHQLADLFLDTLPYNAHTTASDALWTGLPVLTCTGTTFAGRVASSLLKAIDLPELVTTSLREYESRALQLARDPIQLAEIRQRLAHNRSDTPLFDSARYTSDIEAAFTYMWERWSRGETSAPLSLAGKS